MDWKVLTTEEDYAKAGNRLIQIFHAEPHSSEFEEMQLLLVLIKDYDDKYYQIHEFDVAEKRMNQLLNITTEKGGFDFLTSAENFELNKVSLIVESYEERHYPIPKLSTLDIMKFKALKIWKELFMWINK